MNKKITLLLLILLLAGAGLWWFLQTNHDANNSSVGNGDATESWLPAISIANVQSWSVSTAADNGDEQPQLTIRRQDSQTNQSVSNKWVIAQKGDYPANASKVVAALREMLSAKVIEKKTDNPKYYDRLGVQGIAAEGSDSQLVKLNAADISTQVILGKGIQFGGEQATYVRLADQAQSLLVSGKLRQDTDAINWLAKDILNVDREQVKAVVITQADSVDDSNADVLRVYRDSEEDDVFAIDNVPADRQLLHSNVASSMTNALLNLQLEDVWLASEKAMTPTATAVFTLFDGTTITGKVDAEHHLTLAVIGDSEQAQQWRENTQGWVYKISAFKADFFTKTLENMLKPLPAEADEENAEVSEVE